MFAELLQNRAGADPGQEQAEARQNFSSRVSQSSLIERRPSECVPSEGLFVVIGIASYSPNELKLLDEVDAKSCGWGTKLKVAVFDVMSCRTMADFERYIPGIGDVYQTPVIAVWQAGKLVSSQTGLFAARKALEQERVLA